MKRIKTNKIPFDVFEKYFAVHLPEDKPRGFPPLTPFFQIPHASWTFHISPDTQRTHLTNFQQACMRKFFTSPIVDLHEVFSLIGTRYDLVYEHTCVDLIGWEIEHNQFNWEKYSSLVAKYCPEYLDPEKFHWDWENHSEFLVQYCRKWKHFDPEKFNWKMCSSLVAKYCPEYLDPEKFNWADASWAIIRYCPEHFNPEKFNWADYSGILIQEAPQFFDEEKFNWKQFSSLLAEYRPSFFNAQKFNWQDASWAVAKYCPEHLDHNRYNWKKDRWAVKMYCPHLLKYRYGEKI